MGKIRIKKIGIEEFEKEQAERDKRRREAKKAKKKTQVKGVGLKGGERITVVEAEELKPEAKAVVEETPSDAKAMEGKEVDKPKKLTKKKKKKIISQRYKALKKLVDSKKLYSLDKAIELVKKTSNTRFNSTIEIHINLNIPKTKEKGSLSGTVDLPHGTGKKRVIAIADEATMKKIKSGKLDFDMLVAHPSQMPQLAKFAKVLGPKGLMPNPKKGTISETPEKLVKELEKGQTPWKTEPNNAIVHLAIGKASFTKKQIQENLLALLQSIGIDKIQKLTLASTMGPGIKVDLSSLA